MKNINNFKVDFIGIGAQKSATTWIYNCLLEHPEVCGPEKKELAFFHHERTPPFRDKKIAKKAPIEEQGMRKYKEYFSYCEKDKIKGEFTPAYLYYPESPKLIQQYFPEVKLIACLRNPVERAYSHFSHEVTRLDLEGKEFAEALKQEPEFIERGKYYSQLKRYYEIFPEENILVLIYEDIQEDPLAFIQEIYEFLGIDSDFEPSLVNVRINAEKRRMSSLARFVHLNVTPLLRKCRVGKRIKQSPFVRKTFYKFVEKPTDNKSEEDIKPEAEDYIKQELKEEIKKLEGLINRDLNHWR